jgi:hypothetical protein
MAKDFSVAKDKQCPNSQREVIFLSSSFYLHCFNPRLGA